MYLRRCAPPNDTLVVFTDHDVVFQGGYDAIRAAYRRASQHGARLLFSTEYESYPGDFHAFYPAKPAGAAFRYLNSGMWAGPAADVIAMLAVMTGAPTPGLMDYYLNWRPADLPGAPKPPRAFRENDQVAYAGLFLAQHFAQACRGAPAAGGRGGGGSCYKFVHDGRERCVAGGRPRCGGEALWREHPLESSMLGMDYGMQLFENMYHAGAHQLVAGRLRHRSSGAQPIAVHFNGPAKVTFESEWRLPWDARGGRTPVACLLSAACTSFDQAAQASAERGFGGQVAILDATLQRLDAGPLNLTCEPCAAFRGC